MLTVTDLLPKRIADRLVLSDWCWESTGWHNDAGYPYVRWEGRDQPLNRVLYVLLIGPIPEGLELDHVVCQRPACCNPWHSEPVTHAENIRRGRAATKTACNHGHDWTNPRNVRTRPNGRRYCAECNRQQCRERYARGAK